MLNLPVQTYKVLGENHLAMMNFSWALDLDPKGINNHIKEAIDKQRGRSLAKQGMEFSVALNLEMFFLPQQRSSVGLSKIEVISKRFFYSDVKRSNFFIASRLVSVKFCWHYKMSLDRAMSLRSTNVFYFVFISAQTHDKYAI